MKKYVYILLRWLCLGVITAGLSFAISVNLIRHAAKQGNPKAQATLGYMYFFGAGVEQNKIDSVKWFARAATSAVHRGAQSVVLFGKKAAKKITTQASHIAEVFTIAPWRSAEPDTRQVGPKKL